MSVRLVRALLYVMKKSKFSSVAALLVVLFTQVVMAISAGEVAPDFSAKNQDGKTINIKDQRGKYVLMFFYPKDETPGCTKQACALRDQYAEIKKMNAVVFGISRQDEKSHKAFASKHKLPFDLLVDADGTIGRLYGVGSMPVVGFSQRQSILIGPDGKVIRFYETVEPETHAGEVLKDLKKAQGKS